MESRPWRPSWPRFAVGLLLAAALVCRGLYAQEQAPVRPPAKPASPAAAPTPADPPVVKILARSQERAGERVYAAGDVEVHYGDLLLFADRVEYNLDTKDVLAEGNVVAQS